MLSLFKFSANSADTLYRLSIAATMLMYEQILDLKILGRILGYEAL